VQDFSFTVATHFINHLFESCICICSFSLVMDVSNVKFFWVGSLGLAILAVDLSYFVNSNSWEFKLGWLHTSKSVKSNCPFGVILGPLVTPRMLISLSHFIFTFFHSSLLDFISGTSKFRTVIFNLVPTSIG